MAENKDDDVRRKALEEKCISIKKKAEDGLKWGAEFAKDMSEIVDASVLGVKAAKYGSPYADWESAISSFERLDNDLDKIGSVYRAYYTVQPVLSSSSTSIISLGSALVTGLPSMYETDEERELAALVSAAYGRYFEKYKLKDEVLDYMTRFGFVSSARGRKAIEKFKRGWEMFYMELPEIDASIGAVIPLRASIKLAIDELITLRPSQPRGYKPKRKIIEIGTQLRVDAVKMDVFEEMEQKYPNLVDDLSGTKDNLLDRERRYELMRLGTLFLKQLFSSLDTQKLRKRRPRHAS